MRQIAAEFLFSWKRDKALPAVLLLIVQTLLLGYLSWSTSMNRTESAHLCSAAYLWQTGRFDLFHVNPPLTRYFTGLPVYLFSPDYDWKPYSPRPQDRSEWACGAAFIAANEPETIRQLTFFCRCTLIPLILLGGWYGFKLTSEIFGNTSGLIFIMLWTFSPLFLGWGATLCPDMTAAALGMSAVYYFRRWLLIPSWKNVIAAGICIGILPLVKLTWLIAFGLFPLIWCLAANKPPVKQLCIMLCISLYILNTGYLFDGTFRLLKDYTFNSKTLGGEGTNRFFGTITGYIPVPLPSEFVQGIDTQKRDFDNGLESYLFGKYQKHGWCYYYFIVLALKEPLGNLLLACIAFVLLFQKHFRGQWNDEILIILPMFVFLLLLCSQDGFSIHPRYLLPFLPFFYIFISRAGRCFLLKQKTLQVITAVCLVGAAGSSIWSYPYSMAYFNELIPVQKRPEILLGSNIDWGQNVYFLKNWLDRHKESVPIRIAYNSPENLNRIGIKSEENPPNHPEPGWYAAGVNDLYASSGEYS